MVASALLITSAAFHALWNYTLKRSQHKLGAALGFMIVATLLNGIFSALTAPPPHPSFPLIFGILAAGVFEGYYFYLLNTAYGQQGLGVAYTIMRGGAMVLVWLISTLALNETITTSHGISITGILLGIALMQRSFSLQELLASGAYAAYICAGCIAGYHIAYGLAVQTGAAPAFVFAAAMTLGVLTYILCSRGTALKHLCTALSHERRLVLFGGTACGLSFLLFLTALATVAPGHAISLRNTSVVFGVALSIIAGEKFTAWQWLGVTGVIGGALGLILAG
jgi:drug/metabolite transporter (DMT)-like permease